MANRNKKRPLAGKKSDVHFPWPSVFVALGCIVVGVIFVGFETAHATVDVDVQELLYNFKSDKAFEYTKHILSFGPRNVGSPSHRKVREYMTDFFSELGWQVELDAFIAGTPHGDLPFSNIVATLDPSAPKRLILAAHYDSKFFASGYFVGAIDSAAPCGMIMDVAEYLTATVGTHGSKFDSDRTVQIVMFDGEEALRRWSHMDSIYGARHLARLWALTTTDSVTDSVGRVTYVPHRETPATAPEEMAEALEVPTRKVAGSLLEDVDALILLDLLGAPAASMISHFDSTYDTIFASLLNAENLLSQLGHIHRTDKTRTPYFVSGKNNRFKGGADDDHRPFVRLGVPVVHAIPLPFPSVWHRVEDDLNALDEYVVEDLTRVFLASSLDYLGVITLPQTVQLYPQA
eukprot:Rmarinus@m.5607